MKKLLLLFAASGLSLGLCAQQENAALHKDPECIMLTISGNPATERTVSWRTSIDDTLSIAELAEQSADPTFIKNVKRIQGSHAFWETDAADYKMGHKVRFAGLKPDTQYAYRVGNGEQWSEWFQFETSSDKADAFSFLYFGDVQNDIKSLGSRILRQAYTHFPQSDFMLFAGDLVGRSTRDYWDEFFYAGGWLFGTIPSMPIAGNHEYYPNGKEKRAFSKHWNQIYTMPDNAPSEEFRNRAYYVDYQGVRFVGVDAVNVKDEKDGPMIMEWLERTLKSNPCKWCIVFLHYPVYSCSQGRDAKGYRETLKPVLERYGVDLVLQGHDHTYCRGFNTDEIGKECKNPPVYVVSVAGSKMYGLNVSFWSDRMASKTQLYQHIAIDGDELIYQAFDVTGALYDAFRLVKRQGKTNLFIENEAVKNIKMNTQIPDNFLKKYTPEELKWYNEKTSE